MKAATLLKYASQTIIDRDSTYGDFRALYDRAAIIANATLGLNLTPYEILMILHSVKLARMGGPENIPDNYLDGINYLAMANELRYELTPEQMIDDSAAQMAAKLAPVYAQEACIRNAE